MKNLYRQVDENKFRSGVVIVCFVLFVTLASYFITYAMGFDSSFIGIALIISGLLSYSSYYFSDTIILAISNAVPASKKDHFNLYTVTENLATVAQIPMPKLYVIEDTAMNAFATGRDPEHAIVCATTGLLNRLNRTELEGVIAHELSHVRNYDIRLMGIVTILVGLVTLLADFFLRLGFRGKRSDSEGNSNGIFFLIGLILALLSPLIAKLIQLAISRRREYLADASGVTLTRYPEGLASALEKISADREPLEAANKATAHLYIANPLKNHHDSIGWFANLFNTHPPVKDRIKVLRGQ